MPDNKDTDNALLANAIYRWTLQSDLNLICGLSSRLVSASGAEAVIAGETIENIRLGKVDGRTLALYHNFQLSIFNCQLF